MLSKAATFLSRTEARITSQSAVLPLVTGLISPQNLLEAVSKLGQLWLEWRYEGV